MFLLSSCFTAKPTAEGAAYPVRSARKRKISRENIVFLQSVLGDRESEGGGDCRVTPQRYWKMDSKRGILSRRKAPGLK